MAPQNPLPIHGNDKTMNLNSLILTNIQSSPYFKVNLYELKTYHEVIDEIYYKVDHLEPWEKGSRKTAGQTGMCGGVRGVGAGGIVSSAFCLLYKLFTLRLTHKQVVGLCAHNDSPYIRGLGFMYIRYTQHPGKLWEWYQDYLEDEEEIDVKAGGGHPMQIGEMLRQWLVKLEWYSTLFPRIPVNVQKENEIKLREFERNMKGNNGNIVDNSSESRPVCKNPSTDDDVQFGLAERISRMKHSTSPISRSKSPLHRKRSPHTHNNHSSPHRSTSHERDRGSYTKKSDVKDSYDKERHNNHSSPHRSTSHDRDRGSYNRKADVKDSYDKEKHNNHSSPHRSTSHERDHGSYTRKADAKDSYDKERENRMREREREDRLRLEKQREKEERIKLEKYRESNRESNKEKQRDSHEKKKNRHRSRSVEKKHKDKKHKKHKSERKRSRSRSVSRSRSKEKKVKAHKKPTIEFSRSDNYERESSFERDLRREKERQMYKKK